MKRKVFINRLTLGTGSTVLLPTAILFQSCTYKPHTRSNLTEADIPFLDEIAEAIIPNTENSPGAKAAHVGGYILLMYKDCMAPKHQEVLCDGINELDALSSQTFSNSFLKASAPQKLELLEALRNEAVAHKLKMETVPNALPHYFDLLKGLTVSGYFSSEIGMTQAREYLPVPGKYIGCMPYGKEDKPWAS